MTIGERLVCRSSSFAPPRRFRAFLEGHGRTKRRRAGRDGRSTSNLAVDWHLAVSTSACRLRDLIGISQASGFGLAASTLVGLAQMACLNRLFLCKVLSSSHAAPSLSLSQLAPDDAQRRVRGGHSRPWPPFCSRSSPARRGRTESHSRSSTSTVNP